MRITKYRTNIAFALALVALASSVVFAQGGLANPAGQSTKGAVVKNKAPVNKEILKVKLPRAQEATLPNGLRVVLFGKS